MLYMATDAKSSKLRGWIEHYLTKHGYQYQNLGAKSTDDELDITDFLPRVAARVVKYNSQAIVACGNGVGVSIGMNRFKGIRAALAATPHFAEWGRMYDDCNVLCMAEWGAKNKKEVELILDAWFKARFEPLPRRIIRLKKMDELG